MLWTITISQTRYSGTSKINRGHFGDTASVLNIILGGCPFFGGQKHIKGTWRSDPFVDLYQQTSFRRGTIYYYDHDIISIILAYQTPGTLLSSKWFR